ncbi:MAG: histidine kinase dimerization/phospho-acceptor domain-containing protein [Gemmatimonadota bacterium]
MASNTDDTGADVRANRYDVLSRLADDLAHEIKNPLNAIVVNLEVLKRRVAAGSADAALERAAVIEHEIRRVHGLIDQVLQLLRPSKPEPAQEAVDGIIDSLASALLIQAKAAHVALQIETEGSLYAQLRPDSFKFALLNLVSRAIDAEAKAGGDVTIEAKRAGQQITVIVSCSRATLGREDQHIRLCGALMASAGGALEGLEPHHDAAGSRAILVMPPARFA